ncbi:putative O-methyltransferase YrrM [Arcicella sp. BE140]|nr:putative O-methyltransferase YrrM [Arcicella sp. BE140]
MLKNERVIEITDFGAGSKIHKSTSRQIKQIAKSAEKPSKFGKLIFRLIQHFEPKVIFDLGTSLGVTTVYESKAKQDAKIVTFEGCPTTAKIAQENFDALEANNIEIVVGNLDETLTKQIAKIERLDFAFFDANHRYEPTVKYFEICLEKAHESSLFIFDDIHWSEEMQEAWQYIKAHPSVMITIDLFFIGLVFFRKNQPKQDFILRF